MMIEQEKRRKGVSNSPRRELSSPSVATETKTFEIRGRVTKVNEELGIVFGWAIVCSEGGEPYYDTQGDHIPDSAMLKATTKFAKGARVVKDMHTGLPIGTVLHLMPLTDEVADAFGITCEKRGLMIAMEPEPDMLAKFKSGELNGFSIGGRRIHDEVVAE